MEKVKVYEQGYIEEQTTESVLIRMTPHQQLIQVNDALLNGLEHELSHDDRLKEGLIAVLPHQDYPYYLHVKAGHVYLTPYLNGYSEKSINLTIEPYQTRFDVEKSTYSYVITDNVSGEKLTLDATFFEVGVKPVFQTLSHQEGERFVYLKMSYHNRVTFLEFTKKTQVFSLKTNHYVVLLSDASLDIIPINNNQFKLRNGKFEQRIKLDQLLKAKECILEEGVAPKHPVLFSINKRLYAIEKKGNDTILKQDTRQALLVAQTDVQSIRHDDQLMITGTVTYKLPITTNQLVTAAGLPVATVEWEGNHFTALLDNQQLAKLTSIHNQLWLAKDDVRIHPLKSTLETSEIKFFDTHQLGDWVYVLRRNQKNNYYLSRVPFERFYSKGDQKKIKRAEAVASYLKKRRLSIINLFFEKEASRALESSVYVFEKVKQTPNISSKNYFILDETSKQYSEMKKKWGRSVVKRFSFKHYVLIFLADHFIASELSPHVLATRVYIDSLFQKIKDTPLYFLQHGIMFAKPVDNPMAKGFHKENRQNNVVKNVISSDLEAGEFYKMGYDEKDLMKTGLPKLDGAYLNKVADKIAFMPTWRYWEELAILNNEVEQTTYYQSLIEVIQLFEKHDLLDRLLVVPHNKFADYIFEQLPQYRAIICTDPTEALKISQIFITDYSSIIYDAIARGAFPIFYWKDADYLIEQYKAIPPVNADNAPGMIAWSESELMMIIDQAIAANYELPAHLHANYRRINEFSDRKNSERVVAVLKADRII